MKKILKILLISAVLLTTAIVFTSCKQFIDNPEEFLGYWSSEVVPTGFSIDKPYQTSNDGALCIPSDSPVTTLTIKLHNPRKFSLITPTSTSSAADVQKIINFPGLLTQPTYGMHYTLEQTPDKTALRLTYNSGFWKKYEWGKGNISPEITLTSTDGRKFNKKFSLNLKADTAPKLSSSITIGKTKYADADGKRYYVIILQAEDMAEMAGTGSSAGKRQKDIKKLSVTGGDSADIVFGSTGFAASGRLLASAGVDHLSGDETSPAAPSWNAALNNDSWALRYRTDTEVKTARKNYTFTLIDEAGLKSSDIHVSTPATKAEDAKLYYNSKDISTQAGNPSSPYLISTESSITVKAKTETTGASIAGKLFRKTSSGWNEVRGINSGSNTEVDITLEAPSNLGQEIEYKISLTTGGEGFAAGTAKEFYVKVRKGTVLEIKSSDINPWTKLKTEVERSSGGPDIIKITGKIKAPSGPNNQINVSRTVKIMGSNKNTDILDADDKTFIFDIWSSGKLTLEKLTLQKGKNTDSSRGGGAIYCAGGELTAVDVIIKDCEAKNGGGIYVHNHGNIILIDTEIKGCTAAADGGGVYVGVNGTFKMHGGTIKNNTSTLGKGVCVQGSTGGMYISDGEFIMGGEACVGKWENGTLQDGNDVYLDEGSGSLAHIKIDKGKPITKSKAACITPKSYGDETVLMMLGGSTDVGAYNDRFTVTPEDLGSGNTQTWSIDDNGKLTSHTKVRYDQLEAFLTSPQVSSTAINRIEITGEIPQNHFDGSSSGSGELNKRIKKAGSKKLALKLPAGISGVTSMENCFSGCGNLVSVENIPSSITNMKDCFLNCTSLTIAPSIPNGVMNMEGCFYGCKKLTTAPTIPNSVKNMKECFLNCTGLTTVPGISNIVVDMEGCFRGCTELTIGPNIPSSVTNMNSCFLNCTKLKGVKINRGYLGCNFTHTFLHCSDLDEGGIKVPSTYLQTYKNNAATMGTNLNKFSAI
ncbi:leucine-rich repeat domain-containing protein [Treponema denticola]|uniref:leucine-rich repeat domain-containing protein n=1 Tax=Treponema denticola TaxID=158 RepID=UPI0021037F15|nr:leucine-rich repeat domain-containing protein [Treponema denticola]UTY26294.1 leucine-rich repeat domain-containing protein [Treponema denticola]